MDAVSNQTFAASPAATARASAVPWYCYAVVFGAACVPLGVMWDISWHMTIGRDTFWTPAHIMIYLGGAVPGSLCGWLVLRETFWGAPESAGRNVRLWGFRGPMGAWVVIWGAFAMLLSAPFDNWWHNTYGLDVKIISPPHTLLALGTYATAIGGLLFVLSWQNRSGENRSAATWLSLFACGTLLTKMTIFGTEYTFPNQQHNALFYQAGCLFFPLWLVVAARTLRMRWAATKTALIYMATAAAFLWLLPLFPAHPKLAPIYNPVDHMVPLPFPLWLVVPALGLDLIMQRGEPRHDFWRDNLLAILLGVVFFLLLLAAQWPFSEFMLSAAARNRFFGGDTMWSYNFKPGSWHREFWKTDEHPLNIKAALLAVLFAVLQCRLGLAFGGWLSRIKR